MPCRTVKLPGGGVAIVKFARSSNCQTPGCKREHTRLCDFTDGDGKVCSRRICDRHARQVADDVDYCPIHDEKILRAEYGL